MKKLIILSWILILGGLGFIGYHYFSNETAKTDTPPKSAEENTEENRSPAISNIPLPSPEQLENSSIEDLIKLTENYLINQELEKAKTVISTAAEIEPENIDVKLHQAKVNLAERSIEAAKNIVWTLPEDMPNVQYYRGIILVLYKEFEQAEGAFEKVKSNPEASETLKAGSQKFLDAFETFSYYNDADQLFLELLLAKALADVGEHNSAIPLLFAIIQEKNNYRDAWVVLGYCYLNTHEYQEAIDALTQARDMDPEKPETLFFLGLAHFAQNNIDEAIVYLKKADEAGFAAKDQISIKLGDLYLVNKDYQQAAEEYEKALLVKEDLNLDIMVKLVWLNIEKTKDSEKALSLALKTLEAYPQEAISHNLAGWAYTATGQYEEAKTQLEQAIEINPEFDVAHLNIAWLYQKQGFTDLAKEYYKKAYILGKGTAIGNLAAERYNNLSEQEMKNFSELNITSPQ